MGGERERAGKEEEKRREKGGRGERKERGGERGGRERGERRTLNHNCSIFNNWIVIFHCKDCRIIKSYNLRLSLLYCGIHCYTNVISSLSIIINVNSNYK